MSGRYEQVEVQVGGMWECRDCGALVADRELHDRAVHAEWKPTRPSTIPPRQYDGRGPAPGVYRDPAEQPRTAGGDVAGGRPYFVGERGPEIIIPEEPS